MTTATAVLLTLEFIRLVASCELSHPVDIGRTLSLNSLAEIRPFTSANVTEKIVQESRYRTNLVLVEEHTSTHLDAPYRFYEEGWSVDQIPLYRLITNAIFLNLTEEVDGNPNFLLQPFHIEEWIDDNGFPPGNAIVLITYGWSDKYGNKEEYLGTTSTDPTHRRYPGMSTAAAVMLAEMNQVVAVGVDTPSVDPAGETMAQVILSAVNVYSLVNINLNQPCLPARGFQVYAMPVKINGGTGAPCRVIAVPNCGIQNCDNPSLEKPPIYEDHHNIL